MISVQKDFRSIRRGRRHKSSTGYAAIPRARRYSTGLHTPNEIWMRCLLCQRMYVSRSLRELLNARVLPVSGIEQRVLESAEEAFTGCVVRGACFARHRASKLGVAHSR